MRRLLLQPPRLDAFPVPANGNSAIRPCSHSHASSLLHALSASFRSLSQNRHLSFTHWARRPVFIGGHAVPRNRRTRSQDPSYVFARVVMLIFASSVGRSPPANRKETGAQPKFNHKSGIRRTPTKPNRNLSLRAPQVARGVGEPPGSLQLLPPSIKIRHFVKICFAPANFPAKSRPSSRGDISAKSQRGRPLFSVSGVISRGAPAPCPARKTPRFRTAALGREPSYSAPLLAVDLVRIDPLSEAPLRHPLSPTRIF